MFPEFRCVSERSSMLPSPRPEVATRRARYGAGSDVGFGSDSVAVAAQQSHSFLDTKGTAGSRPAPAPGGSNGLDPRQPFPTGCRMTVRSRSGAVRRGSPR
jgi:hypothetical protein